MTGFILPKLGSLALVVLLAGVLLFATTGVASAHFTMLLPGDDLNVTAQDYIIEDGDTVEVKILWGHPFEHILFDIETEPEVYLRTPDGTVTQLMPTATTVSGYDAYTVSFTVAEEGDHILYAKYESPDEELVDYVKVVFHCGEEMWEGWDTVLGQEVEMIPYTRPYGLEKGFVFMGKAILSGGTGLSGATAEIEKYNTAEDGATSVTEAEEDYAEDPPMMFTRVTNTNESGEFAYTIDEPGIWFVGVTEEIEGAYDNRGIMIVPVFDAYPAETDEEDSGSDNTWAIVALVIAVLALVTGGISLALRKK